jgi:hypothetical protein
MSPPMSTMAGVGWPDCTSTAATSPRTWFAIAGPNLAIFCKAWRGRNASGRYAKDQSASPGASARPAHCGSTAPSSNGRSASIHPTRELLAGLRQHQKTLEGRAQLRERVAVEHALADVRHRQGRRARYNGVRKNLFDLRRVAIVHNLHAIARQNTTIYELEVSGDCQFVSESR